MFEIIKNHCSLREEECFETSNVTGSHDFNLPEHLLPYANMVCKLFADAEDKLSSFCSNVDCLSYPKSVGDYLLEVIDKYVEMELDDKKANVLGAVFDWHVRLMAESNAAEPLTTLSALSYGKYEEYGGAPYTEIRRGYDQIIKYLVNVLGDAIIVLNAPVVEINWEHGMVAVKTREKTYEADYVVMTVPLGVLKASHRSIFSPCLPETKIAAITNIGFGIVDKIFLEFDEPFWQTQDFSDVNFNVLWMDGLNYQGRCYSKGYATSLAEDELGETWFRYIVRFCCVLNHDKVLCAWIVGEGAKFSETLSDDLIVGKCRDVLVGATRTSISLPKILKRSRWFHDEYTRGSYSFISNDSDVNFINHKHLAEPVYREDDGVNVSVSNSIHIVPYIDAPFLIFFETISLLDNYFHQSLLVC